MMALFPAETQYEVTTAAGRTYFFLARPSTRAQRLNAMSAAGGLSGLVVGAIITSGGSNPGPFDFFPMDASAARQMMADIPLAETSRVR